jgi:hypothetical protein
MAGIARRGKTDSSRRDVRASQTRAWLVETSPQRNSKPERNTAPSRRSIHHAI